MLDKHLVVELRRKFVDGATPSQLMHCIAKRHPNDPCLHLIIMDYFREAFRVPLLRNVVSGEDYSPSSRHAHFNRDVVPEMVRLLHEQPSANLKGSWLDGVTVHSLTEHFDRLHDARFEELDRVWGQLNQEEKEFIIRRIAHKDYHWEVMKALAALAERLQQQVVELEDQLKKNRSAQANGEGEVASSPAH